MTTTTEPTEIQPPAAPEVPQVPSAFDLREEAERQFLPQFSADALARLRLREPDTFTRRLIGQPDHYDVTMGRATLETMELAAHEAAVIRWLRGQLLRTANPFEKNNVGVLLVGEARHTGVVDHQLDHCGGGITSGSHGGEIASGEYSPEGMIPGDGYNRAWSITANLLIDQCTDDADVVTLPEQGEILTARECGSAAFARVWFATWPGKLIECVGAYSAARQWVRELAEAEAFFAAHGEWQAGHETVNDDLGEAIADVTPALAGAAQRLGRTPGALLREIAARLESEAAQ